MVGAAVVLVPRLPLIRIMLLSQVVNGMLLPFVLIYMLRLANDEKLMGVHRNGRWFNVVAWTTAAPLDVASQATRDVLQHAGSSVEVLQENP